MKQSITYKLRTYYKFVNIRYCSSSKNVKLFLDIQTKIEAYIMISNTPFHYIQKNNYITKIIPIYIQSSKWIYKHKQWQR